MKKTLTLFAAPVIGAILAFLLVFFEPLSTFDFLITDRLYSQLRKPNPDIMIIRIDEKTLNEYGSFSSWSRTKVADVVEKLYEDPNNTPLAVGIDITFQGDSNPETDQHLADVCNKDIVTSGALVFKGKVENNQGTYEYNAFNVSMIEYPFAALREKTITGYANAFLGKDTVDRYYMASIDANGEHMDSFAYALAKIYANKKGIELTYPKTDSHGLFRFFYAGRSGEYPHISMKTVLDGNVPASEFKDKVVLIGAYASGMQDSYMATADVESQVYGVEIQANVLQAILDEATAISFNKTVHAVVLAALVFVLLFVAEKAKMAVSIALPVIAMVIHAVAGKVLSGNGYLITQLYALVMFVGIVAYAIIRKYVAEALKRQHVMKVFGKYMEPKLVNELIKEGSMEMNLGGTKREVSVLFVDVRGFTTMSENLEPEEVVGILNEYLGLVTECIFKHHGMLDKFIGDAAMAIFNAPADQDDYIYESVAAAYDIAQGSNELSKKLLEKFGKTISYGIGVNCGPAVIGNIGCEFRMDYTAIGDTVNTSARLEASAGKGEILLPEHLVKKLEGRIIVEEAGPMKFKGKAEPINVYRLIGLKG